jgi:hypothetical protein
MQPVIWATAYEAVTAEEKNIAAILLKPVNLQRAAPWRHMSATADSKQHN